MTQKFVSLQCVFHGIRFKVNNEDCGCRETTFSFFNSHIILSPSYFAGRIYMYH